MCDPYFKQAVLKIIKHCRESYPNDVTGQLLGLDEQGTLEVTNCFPFPSDTDENASGKILSPFVLMSILTRVRSFDSFDSMTCSSTIPTGYDAVLASGQRR